MNKSHNALLRMLLCFLPLIGIVCFTAGCGPENCQARFLASWSADGTRVALVPDPDSDSDAQSGLWIASLEPYAARELVVVPPGHLCLYPQWSSSGEEILFGVLDDSEQGKSDPDKSSPFAVWIARTDGSGARRFINDAAEDPRVRRVSLAVGVTLLFYFFEQFFWPAPLGVLVQGVVIGGLPAVGAVDVVDVMCFRINVRQFHGRMH